MRTTLTIDDDVAVQLERLRREPRREPEGGGERSASPRVAGNRRSAKDGESRSAPVRCIGKKPLLNIDNVAEVLAMLEGEDFK